MKRQVGSSRGRLTRTLFSVLSPLISSLTLFLSDSFTFLPTASRTLSEHRRQERDRLNFWTWRKCGCPKKNNFYFLSLNKTPTWHQRDLFTWQLSNMMRHCRGNRPLLLHVFSVHVSHHHYSANNLARGTVINQKRAAVLIQDLVHFFLDTKTFVFKCQVSVIDRSISK